MKESGIQGKILKYLISIKAYPIKIVAASRAGNPDIVVCYRGMFIAIEVKQPGKQASPLQKAKITAIKQAGGIAFVADDLEVVKQAFGGIMAAWDNLNSNINLISKPEEKK